MKINFKYDDETEELTLSRSQRRSWDQLETENSLDEIENCVFVAINLEEGILKACETTLEEGRWELGDEWKLIPTTSTTIL